MFELEEYTKVLSYYHPYYYIDLYLIGGEQREVLTGIKDLDIFNYYLLTNSGEAPKIPNSIQVIANRALQNVAKLEYITLPSSLLEIGDAAFRRTGLKYVDFSNCKQLSTIGSYAFYDAKFKDIIDLSDCEKLRLIDDYAFGLNNCVLVNLPSNSYRIHIGEGAFSKRNGGNARQTIAEPKDMEQTRLF